MPLRNELLERDDIKVGGVYRKELLDFYAADFRTMVVIPDFMHDVALLDSMGNYLVTQIIDNCEVVVGKCRAASHEYYQKIILIKKI